VNSSDAGRIRTFHARTGRISANARAALERRWATHGHTIGSGPLDATVLFGRPAPLVLEIGAGMGDATLGMAAADPDRNYLAVDVHTPGLSRLLAIADQDGIGNVRAARGDALTLLRDAASIPPASVDAIHIFFPDPWPKARHHKRRMIQPETVALLRDRLKPGGILHTATDWAHYAEQMLAVLALDPELVNAFDGVAPRPTHRPETKYERRGTEAGRTIVDLIFIRRPGHTSGE
jgi:tRNA (guanine-N7-)-methyltransferase